ncbi:MAG TPA: FAD-binding protein, partial [Fimbriimonadaceae bacterium]|nr:FAD-binding protein [Fimbriimonadaceae bacterium]
VRGGRCVGVSAMVHDLGMRNFSARAVLLATGGCGRMYQNTTNPSVATADGIALALRAGARVENMEFMQFHPTTLYHPQMRSFLITEAVRGAGGTLRNHLGQRFMYDYDDRLELAPRDVVARAMEAEMKRLSTWCLYLDIAHLPKSFVEEEFPTICERLHSIDLEMYKDWIPVVPAQHYSCGGVWTDLSARTTLPGLYAAGEVACTGVHGANRLASNSLLEALVFADAAAIASKDEPETSALGGAATLPRCVSEAESIRIRRNLQHVMTQHSGIVRSNAGLREAAGTLASLLEDYTAQADAPYSQHPLETFNLLQAAASVVTGAAARTANIGLHYNEDLV